MADNKIRETPSNLLSNPWKVAETRKFPNRFRRKPLKFDHSAPKADNARWKKRGNEVLTRSTGGCASHVENDKWGISIPRIPEEEDSVSKDVFVCLFIYLFMQRIKASTSITPPRFLHFLLLLFSPAEICSTMTRARADR